MAQIDSTDADETVDGEGSEGTPDQTSSTGADELALARKRQAGAEKARQVAEEQKAALEKELAGYRAANQTAAEKDLTELAKQTARAEAAEKRAIEAESAANAKLLDKMYPDARAKYPEITDEVRLAELQGFFGEAPGTPTPLRHNNESSTGQKGGEKKEPTAAEVKANLLAMPSPF